MTWQRIDDDAYIDDSLVTCVEYQLFIDEMREQGKYYQPDHWNSYQFINGDALKPILGIRYSDSIAFCKWLTSRDVGNWQFSLPSDNKTYNFQFKSMSSLPIGYWINSGDKELPNFAWVGSAPADARHIVNVISRRGNKPLDLENYQFLNGLKVNDRVMFDIELYLNRDLAKRHTLDPLIQFFFNNNIDFCFDLITLQERIAGRSPAFEGIRLVKERIK